jgi:hypothetical protein
MITITVDDPEVASAVANGGPQLRDLCQKEVGLFDAYLRSYGREYAGGLSRFERLAIEGYLYQKIRGRVDSVTEPDDLPRAKE